MTNYLSTREVAARLSVSIRWVRAAINAGELPAVNMGKQRNAYRVAEDDLKSFMQSRVVVGIQEG